MGLVVPAVLPSSHDDLVEKLKRFALLPLVDRVQIDVVDGRFASPMSWPYTMPKDIHDMVNQDVMLPHLDRITYEIDLMCLDAERAADAWLELGASRLTFHAEGLLDISKSLASMKKRYGDTLVSFGLALNVTSDISLIEPYTASIDYVQFMGIASIGKQGQPFDKRVLEKLRLFRARHRDMPVQIDGGVTLLTARELIELNVSNLIVGSAIVRAANPAALIEKFEALQNPFGV